MLEILRPFFRGSWAEFGESLRLADPSQPQPSLAQWISSRTHLADALQRHAEWLQSPDELRAVSSDWARHYFSALLPPVVAALSVVRQVVPTSVHDMGLVLGDRGAPLAFTITHLGKRSDAGDPAARYEDLVWEHLHPLIERMRTETHVPRRILWGNVHRALIDIFAPALKLVEHDKALSQRLIEDRRQLLESRTWRDGRRNPLFLRQRQVMVPVQGGLRHVVLHASCCLAWKLKDTNHCHACPLAPKHIHA